MSTTDFLETVLEAARAHGEQSEPDHEVGDLQGLARDLWSVMTPRQREKFARNETYLELVKEWTP